MVVADRQLAGTHARHDLDVHAGVLQEALWVARRARDGRLALIGRFRRPFAPLSRAVRGVAGQWRGHKAESKFEKGESMRNPYRRRRLPATCVVALASLVSLLTLFSPVGVARAQSATVNATVRIGPVPSPTPGGCSGSVTFRLEPISLTGSSGRSTAFSFGGSYHVRETNTGPGTFWCFVRKSTGNVRTGRWRMTAQLQTWGTSCTIDLHRGNNSANFTRFRSGCRTGFSFP